jgi:hypothetical protein
LVGAFLKQGYNVVATSRNVSQQLTASTTVVLIDGGIGKPETAAKVVEAAGWYAFRHTYRTLLDDLGTPVGVQQKLMRYSDIRTTMNVMVRLTNKGSARPMSVWPASCWSSQQQNS